MGNVGLSVGFLEDGTVVTIDEYDKRIHGKALYCPHCQDDSMVFGRKGLKRKHSFAHYPYDGRKECKASPDRDLHILVQDLIASGAMIALPDFNESLRSVSRNSGKILFDHPFSLSDCIKEAHYSAHGDIRKCSIDVEGTMPNGVRLLVEVTVTHETCDPQALAARTALFRPCVEFKCTDLVGKDWSRESIRKALQDPNRWSWFQLFVLNGAVGNFNITAQVHPDGNLLLRFSGFDNHSYRNLVHANGGLSGFTARDYGVDDNVYPLNRLSIESLKDLENRTGIMAVNKRDFVSRKAFDPCKNQIKTSSLGLFSELPVSRRLTSKKHHTARRRMTFFDQLSLPL